MHRLTPYQTGLWLAEYLNVRCQLCRIYRSTAQSQLLMQYSHANSNDASSENSKFSPSSNQSLFAHICHQINHRSSRGLLCTYCHNSIVWLPQPFDVDIVAGRSLFIQVSTYYEYPMRQAIRAFKHHEDMTKLPSLLHALRQLPRPHGCHHNNSVIVAMPTTNQRLVKRGFDPVSILSSQLSKHWQIPLWQGVERIDDTVS
ncbi:ComF family protein [Psychrobacter piscatorii]|uniref:ComF family protein n=1 Tax=Psychrobacter piscatorii TaxID=554343 RepID=UPI001D0F4B3B|nr:ComF family protein [Psychrobacter piscatorii]